MIDECCVFNEGLLRAVTIQKNISYTKIITARLLRTNLDAVDLKKQFIWVNFGYMDFRGRNTYKKKIMIIL